MKERPILFSAPMIRALLDGRKTQTRRVVKPMRHPFGHMLTVDDVVREIRGDTGAIVSPYGQPGDRLWVREATVRIEEHGYIGPVYVESDDGRMCLDSGIAPSPDDCTDVEPYELRIRPSIHMPRNYCRILLEITGIRVERLQDISEDDARAEGSYLGRCDCFEMQRNPKTPIEAMFNQTWCHIHGAEFKALWKEINGPGAWNANPWVWVVEFRRFAE